MTSCISCMLLIAAAAAANPAAELRVWTVTGTRHVLRSEPPGSGPAVKLAAARNEWESFQVLLRSDAAVKAVRIEAGDLKGPGGAVLAADTARVFRQHQMHVEIGTSTSRYFPARGTAGLARSLVRGNRRVPWPPPMITHKTVLVFSCWRLIRLVCVLIVGMPLVC